MCGIVGIVRWGATPVTDGEIQRMTDAVAHRGPDGQGTLVRDGVALGHRRLAIIDLEAGAQPLSNEDGNVWVTYNGEIYNYRELARELAGLGHIFRTHCDTEVIVHAYEEWGDDCVKRFRGMFAFAIADFRRRRVLLARDHFGIKPLYYRIGSDYLAFASELSAIRAVDDIAPVGSLQSIEYYLRFSYDPTPGTIYRDTLKLSPASTMVVELDGRRHEPVSYWDLSFAPREGLSDAEWEEQAIATFSESVEAHLVSDVPFGVFLSGGIDSTLVAGEMSRILDRRVRAYGIGFNEERFSEMQYARAAADRYGIDLVTEVVDEDAAIEIIPDLIAHYGQPFGDSSAIPTWFVSRLARRDVPMVLSGDGGDEAFGGYHSYVQWLESATLGGSMRRYAPMKQASMGASARALVRATRRYLENARSYRVDEWQRQITLIGGRGRQDLWRKELRGITGGEDRAYAGALENAETFDRLAYAQYLDFRTYLPNDILTKVDVASMYHGLEVRTPLIDLRVVELAASLPMKQRVRRNGDGSLVAKSLPKRVLERTFPREFTHRHKMGFGMPRAVWFLPGGRGRAMLDSVLLDRASRLRELFDRSAIEMNLALHTEAFDNSGPLWLLLVLGLWLEANPDVGFG
jgi:asparagine synthase (glutamine-hydrolysing)